MNQNEGGLRHPAHDGFSSSFRVLHQQ